MGLVEHAYWQECRCLDLKPYDGLLQHLEIDETESASELSRMCMASSRGFMGQSPQWLVDWMCGKESGLVHSNAVDSAILVEKVEDELIGFICVAIYNETLWIRELAVMPAFQDAGVGSRLMVQAMTYGKNHNVKKGFLMADILNKKALHLYEKFGFLCDTCGQLDMIKINEEKNLSDYLGKNVHTLLKENSNSTIGYGDRDISVQCGYIPNTRSILKNPIEVYVKGMQVGSCYCYGKVLGVIHDEGEVDRLLISASASV